MTSIFMRDKTMLRSRHVSVALLLTFVLVLGCGGGGNEAVPTQTLTPLDEGRLPVRTEAEVPVKEPFDRTRLADVVDLAEGPKVVNLDPPATPEAPRYGLDLEAQVPSLIGFDIQAFPTPSGYERGVLDVDGDGAATLPWLKDEKTAVWARVQVFSSPREARAALLQRLSLSAARLDPLEIGDVGFGLRAGGTWVIALFCRGNVLMEARRGQDDQDVAPLAAALDAFAQTMPAASAQPAGTTFSIHVDSARVGQPAEISTDLGEALGLSGRASGSAAIDHYQGRLYLLASEAGRCEVTLTAWDRWLRRLEVRGEVDVAP